MNKNNNCCLNCGKKLVIKRKGQARKYCNSNCEYKYRKREQTIEKTIKQLSKIVVELYKYKEKYKNK